jgi:hypothetical protein
MNEFEAMRSFIVATQQLSDEMDDAETLNETAVPSASPLVDELEDVIFRLRAFMENAGGDYALGVETGMQRAADMIENVLARHGRR